MLVLCYHKIDFVSQDWTGIITSPGTFHQQMLYLKSNYHICDIHSLPDQPKMRDVLITFDDGYEDNYTFALPILEKLQIPAIFFISTGHLDTDTEDWCNELAWLILDGDCYPSNFSYENLFFPTDTFKQRLHMHGNIEKILISKTVVRRNSMLEAIRHWAAANTRSKRSSRRMLSAQQLRAFADSPYATIGAHTVNHSSLGALSLEEQRHEITESKHTIEKIIGRPVTLFAYPFGGPDNYSTETIHILKSVGFQKAFSTTYKRKNYEPSPFEIPRVCISECTMQEFIHKLELYREKDSYYWKG